jgi:hypothetical protein
MLPRVALVSRFRLCGSRQQKTALSKVLKQIARIHDPEVGAYSIYPELSLLRGDPRLTEFRERLGMSAMPSPSFRM